MPLDKVPLQTYLLVSRPLLSGSLLLFLHSLENVPGFLGALSIADVYPPGPTPLLCCHAMPYPYLQNTVKSWVVESYCTLYSQAIHGGREGWGGGKDPDTKTTVSTQERKKEWLFPFFLSFSFFSGTTKPLSSNLPEIWENPYPPQVTHRLGALLWWVLWAVCTVQYVCTVRQREWKRRTLCTELA